MFNLDLPAKFMKDIEEFIRSVYYAGQDEFKLAPKSKEYDKSFNPQQLMVFSNAACVDLLFWAIREESGGWSVIKISTEARFGRC